MKFITALILLFMLQVSFAALSENHPINPDSTGINYGISSPKNILHSFGVTSISSNGRFIAYFSEHENLEDSSRVDYIAHRYDRILNTTLSSVRIVKNQEQAVSQSIKMVFEGSSEYSIIFTHLNPDSTSSSNFSGFSLSRYDFVSKDISNYKSDVGLGWAISPNGQFFIYSSLGSVYVFDKETATEIAIPAAHTLTNGNVIHFVKPNLLFTHHAVNDQGNIILVADADSKIIEGASRYYQYNVKTKNFISFNDLIPQEYDIDVDSEIDDFNTALWLDMNVPLISNNGKYISLVARKISGKFVILLLDTTSSKVVEHELPFELDVIGVLQPRLLTNTGIAQYVTFLEDTESNDEGMVVYYLYDFTSNKVLEQSSILIPSSDSDISELQWTMVDQVSLDGDFVIMYDALMTQGTANQPEPPEIESSLFWRSLSSDNGNEITIIPTDVIIDPYSNQVSQFSVDVSGSDIYGLDVTCNLSNSALSITSTNYSGLFGDKNSRQLPPIVNPLSLTGTEVLMAPELPFSGKGSFVLADVVAEFTTADVDITCAAEISDENGQLLATTLTPATIKIDDGVHGGSALASGSIEIPGVDDLSGIEVVLTIDGRQVTVVTDENGRFEFDGLRDGDFVISVASDNYVQSCQDTKIADGTSVDLGKIELLAGDINADGAIDITDFTFMAARYRSNQGDVDYDVKADLNKDDTINIQDLAILGSHFGSTQCNPLQ